MGGVNSEQRTISLELLDWELFTLAVEASLTVRSREQFYVWLQGPVHGLVPHQILICGVRNPSGPTMLTQHFSSTRYFRQEHFDAVIHPGRGLLPQVAPMIKGMEDSLLMRPGGEAASSDGLSALIASNELKNIAFKSVSGLGGQMEAYFCYARLAGEFDDRLRSAIEFLTPHLHATFVRMMAHEMQGSIGASSSGAAQLITTRQAEILALVKDGLTNAQIAEALACSQWTVKNHVQNILRRLGTKSRSQALVRAMRLGLLAPD